MIAACSWCSLPAASLFVCGCACVLAAWRLLVLCFCLCCLLTAHAALLYLWIHMCSGCVAAVGAVLLSALLAGCARCILVLVRWIEISVCVPMVCSCCGALGVACLPPHIQILSFFQKAALRRRRQCFSWFIPLSLPSRATAATRSLAGVVLFCF